MKIKYGRIRGCITLLWAACRVLFRPKETEEMLYRGLHLREQCRKIEQKERTEPRAHRGISDGGDTCTDSYCWCANPLDREY